MKVSFFPMKRFCVHPLVLTAALSFAVTAYAQQDTQQVEDRVNKILSQMTLDEKVNYISGAIVNFASLKGVFNIKPIPRLGLPEIFGNDGTIGILGHGARRISGPRCRAVLDNGRLLHLIRGLGAYPLRFNSWTELHLNRGFA